MSHSVFDLPQRLVAKTDPALIGDDELHFAAISASLDRATAAEPVIRAVAPEANVPTSVRTTGIPVRHRPATALGSILDDWSSENTDGIACVIGRPSFRGTTRVRSLTPELAKGLEFDLVVLDGPPTDGVEAAVDRYVAMTRATRELVLLT